MMSPEPTIYRDHGVTHEADTCIPLMTACARGELQMHALVRGTYPGKPLADGVLPGLCTVGHWDAADQQSWGLDWHQNEGVELTFLESGSLPFGVDGHEMFDLHPGCLTVTRPWQPHCVGDPDLPPGCLHWAIIDVGVRRPNQAWQWPEWVVLTPGDLNELTLRLRQNEHPVWPGSVELKSTFKRLKRAVPAAAKGDGLSRVAILLNELLVDVLDILRGEDAKLDEGLTSTERTVDLFLKELQHSPSMLRHPWTVQEMAERCGLGGTYFNRYCRELTNRTPGQFLNNSRLAYAVDLLERDPDLSVTDIAALCGFSSSQYFSTVFRKHHGISPGEFRQQRGTGNSRA